LASEAIQNGMKQWSSKTCITFQERTGEEAFIYFFVGGRYAERDLYLRFIILLLIN